MIIRLVVVYCLHPPSKYRCRYSFALVFNRWVTRAITLAGDKSTAWSWLNYLNMVPNRLSQPLWSCCLRSTSILSRYFWRLVVPFILLAFCIKHLRCFYLVTEILFAFIPIVLSKVSTCQVVGLAKFKGLLYRCWFNLKAATCQQVEFHLSRLGMSLAFVVNWLVGHLVNGSKVSSSLLHLSHQWMRDYYFVWYSFNFEFLLLWRFVRTMGENSDGVYGVDALITFAFFIILSFVQSWRVKLVLWGWPREGNSFVTSTKLVENSVCVTLWKLRVVNCTNLNNGFDSKRTNDRYLYLLWNVVWSYCSG